MMVEGVVLSGREPRPSGGQASAGAGHVCWGFCVRGFCVFGVALVRSLLICSSGWGGLAVHWLGVPGAGGSPSFSNSLKKICDTVVLCVGF